MFCPPGGNEGIAGKPPGSKEVEGKGVEEPKIHVVLDSGMEGTDVANMSKSELKNLLGEMSALTKALSALDDGEKKVVFEKTEQPLEEGMAPIKGDPNEEAGGLERRDSNLSTLSNVEWHQPFGESCYTLIYMCELNSHGFWHGLWIVLMQLLTCVLILIDVVDWFAHPISLSIPAMVSMEVTVAQAVACFLAVPFMSDLIEGILKLQWGFYPELLDDHPAATKSKWLLSCCLQVLAGFILMFDIWILTMQATNVIGIMLNFAALHFIAEIDDLGFKIATYNFITTSLRRQAETCNDFVVPRRKHKYWFRRICYIFALLVLFAGYAIIKAEQIAGRGLPSYLYVQYGDLYIPHLSYYSGIMETQVKRTPGYRKYKDMGTGMYLGYCMTQDEGAWTFSFSEDPCEGVFAFSESTEAYDVTSLQEYQWKIYDNETGRFTSFDTFILVDRDCDSDICAGECVDDLCKCPKDRFGLDCQYNGATVCPDLAVSGFGSPFPSTTDGYAVGQNYELFRNPETGEPVRAYNMPVFYSNDTVPANFIFFAGFRWVLSSELIISDHMTPKEMASSGVVHFPQETADYLESDGFHGHFNSIHKSHFLSEPMEFDSTGFQPTPAGLKWYVANPVDVGVNMKTYEPGQQIDTILECQNCDKGGACDPYGGECNVTTGVCDCKPGYSGDRCDIEPDCFAQDRPCGGDGICDPSTGHCQCFTPYYTKLCRIPYWCVEENGKCMNGGTCNTTNFEHDTRAEGSVDLDCICHDPATTGSACEKRLDCKVWGCANGGTCDSETGKCNCEDPYYGVGCNLVDTDKKELLCQTDKDCEDGTCDTKSGHCDCLESGRYGVLCEHQYSCSDNPCKNNGSCTDSGACECPEPFTGFDCSGVPDCASDEDCVGAGTCDENTGSCNCEDPFAEGKLCQLNRNCKEQAGVDCQNEGTCTQSGYCDCQLPYTGALCDYILEAEAY